MSENNDGRDEFEAYRTLTDEQAVEAAQLGDSQAQDYVLDEYKNFVRSLCIDIKNDGIHKIPVAVTHVPPFADIKNKTAPRTLTFFAAKRTVKRKRRICLF